MKSVIALLNFVIILNACKNADKKRVETVEIKFKKEATLEIIDHSNVPVALFDIEIADDEYERQAGLMYRSTLGKDKGMLFVFDKTKPISFYMKNTTIPLDLIFIGEKMDIVNIHKNAKPLSLDRISSIYPAKYVLEVNAGVCSAHKIGKGMKINYSKQRE